MKIIKVYFIGFPHSEISGSKVATHLPEAYRSYATSFIASLCLGIHRTPLNFLLRNLQITIFSELSLLKEFGYTKSFFHIFDMAIRPLEFKIFFPVSSKDPRRWAQKDSFAKKLEQGLSFQDSCRTYRFIKQKTAFEAA